MVCLVRIRSNWGMLSTTESCTLGRGKPKFVKKLVFKYLKIPISVCKFFLVILNVSLHDVIPSELDVSSVAEKGWHPRHVATRRIKKSSEQSKYIL